MKAKDAMFVWTPNRAPFDSDFFLMRGQVAVTLIPQEIHNRNHPKSAGACDGNWHKANDEERVRMMQNLIDQMIKVDLISQSSLEFALSQVDEFRNHPFHF